MNKRNWLIVLVVILVAVGIYYSDILMTGPAVKEMSEEDCEAAELDCIAQVNANRAKCVMWGMVPGDEQSIEEACAVPILMEFVISVMMEKQKVMLQKGF